MNSEDDVHSPGAVDTVLRRGLHTEALSAEALSRIRFATESEWRGAVRGSRQQSHWGRYATAAAVLLAFIGAWIGLDGRKVSVTAAAIGRLERADYPGAIERHRWSHDRVVSSGELLAQGQNILARGGARIALIDDGSLRVAAGTSLEILSAQTIRLVDGSIYVDVPPASSRTTRLVVQTPAGTFTHLGTQFQVAVVDGQTEVRVREGQVNWHSAAGDSITSAGGELLIDKQGKVTRSQVATAGASWGWVELLAVPFQIENHPLAEFLQHIARETGRNLVYESPAVERRAAATIMHGSIDKLATAEALSAVMVTTSLRFTLSGGSIQIESEGDSKKIR